MGGLYLMEKALDPPGEARPATDVLTGLASRLGLSHEFYPWSSAGGPIDALLDHPSTGHATVGALRGEGGIRALGVSHVAHPDLCFETPSGKVELRSDRAVSLGLPPLPVYEAPPASSYPLTFRQGRTLTQFHGFYDHGRALPTLAKLDPEPRLWISPADASARGCADGAPVRMYKRPWRVPGARVRHGPDPRRHGVDAGWWEGLNRLTSGAACIRDEAVDLFGFSAGQASFDATVEVAPAD